MGKKTDAGVLVTGATGFIGSRLVRLLVRRGETLHVLCRSTARTDPLGEKRVRVFRGDILDRPAVERAMRGCARVFHLAAYARSWARNPNDFERINVEGTRTVLEAARRSCVRRVVLTSSAMTFGPSNGSGVTEATKRTAGFFTSYERSKFGAEQAALLYGEGPPEVVIVNPTRVFGPGVLTEANSVTTLIKWYLEGRWRYLLGRGHQLGNYAFVRDVAEGHLRAMDSGRPGQKYILGGENVSQAELFSVLARLTDRRARLLGLPPRLTLAYAALDELVARLFDRHPLLTPDWVRVFSADWACDSSKAQRELGYAITPLRRALELTTRWLRRRARTAP